MLRKHLTTLCMHARGLPVGETHIWKRHQHGPGGSARRQDHRPYWVWRIGRQKAQLPGSGPWPWYLTSRGVWLCDPRHCTPMRDRLPGTCPALPARPASKSMFWPSIPMLYPRHTALGMPLAQLQQDKSSMHDWKKWWRRSVMTTFTSLGLIACSLEVHKSHCQKIPYRHMPPNGWRWDSDRCNFVQ